MDLLALSQEAISMKTCDYCRRVIDMASIEVAYCDEASGQYVAERVYCSVDCLIEGVH